MSAVSLRGVVKRYGRTAAVDRVSLDVADGEFLVLLGPSGSGKSTLLRLIAGIEPLDGGEIWLGERRIDRLLPRYRDIAMVFQSYALYPHMSVRENLAFPLRSARVARREVRRRVAETAELLGLSNLLRRRPGQLSGGQQQRVALGRAIIRRPSVFLMDEPLSNLDARLRARTRLELVRLQERLGVTTLYVTHDQVEAMTMGRRIAVIETGALHQVDPPERVYEHPADLFVADFIGSPAFNTFTARCLRSGDGAVLRAEGFELVYPGMASVFGLLDGEGGGHDGRPLVVGIRPEYLRIDAGLPRAQSAEMTVERVELLGHERLVHLTTRAGPLVARTPASRAVSPGVTVDVGFLAAGIRLFDPGTGRLLTRPGP